LGWKKSAQSAENKGALFRVLAKIAVECGWGGESGGADRDRGIARVTIFGGWHGLL
jgi:hypothetical protein